MSFEVGEESMPKEEPSPRASLDTSLFDKGSVGLSIMQKMGFKVGEALGSSDNAHKEPIKVVPKQDRLGIGATSRIKLPPEISTETGAEQFIGKRLEELQERKAANAVHKLQKFCFTASGDDDKIDNVDQALEVNPLWRSLAILSVHAPLERKRVLIDQDEESEDKTDFGLTEFDEKKLLAQLSDLIAFSRLKFFYCLFCLVQYDDAEDMAANCPGPTEDDHKL